VTQQPKKMTGLAAAMARSGGTTAGVQPLPTQPEAPSEPAAPRIRRAGVAPSRADLVAITVHAPEAVRRQLKAIAAEEGRPMEDLAAEAFNLLFARYRRPEIAPRKPSN
jgi:hypothetical protein